MKILYIWLVLLSLSYAQKVEISADSFEADEKKRVSILKGNVLLKKGADIVHADKLTIYFDAQNHPSKYHASGGIQFEIYTNQQDFQGHANSLVYDPKTLKYELSGDAYIHEKKQNSELFGEVIMIDRVSGKSSIKGSKKRPVKFIFEVKE
jgi:lipopolysaccharide export system protein LptA